MTEEQKIYNSFLYMYDQQPIAEFLKEANISIKEHRDTLFGKSFATFEFTFTVPAQTYKKFEYNLAYFQAKLKEDLHRYHQYESVLVFLTADWERLTLVSAEVRPVLTPWQEINSMQEFLMSQILSANETISFQNVGNTARHLLRKLSDLVFIESMHTPKNNTYDLGPENFKNRLWAFVLYKIQDSGTGNKVREYVKSLLEASDKAIDLSNSVTHALNADAFLAQSCAISAITTVHVIKLIFDRPVTPED